MTQDDLLIEARRQPFKPFRLHITTGDTYDVVHPDMIMIGKRSAAIGITRQTTGRPVYDRLFLVDLFHIVGVEELPSSSVAPSEGGPNGHGGDAS